jgi:hypothetical protein
MAPTARLTASDGATYCYFGQSVSISGNTVVVGAWGSKIDNKSDQGAAYVFTQPVSGWGNMTETAKLIASDGAAGDSFGSAVSASGNTVVVGAYLAKPTGGASWGAAYVFTEPASAWANATQTTKLTVSDTTTYFNFGASVSISGNTIAVGARGTTANSGTAFTFTKPGSTWTSTTYTAKLNASDGAAGDSFGSAVSASGNAVVVGAKGATIDSKSQQGAAYVFAASATPVVTGVSPAASLLAGGTLVTISGEGFTGATAVQLGGVPLSFTFVSDAQITFTNPAGTGIVDVTVTTANGTSDILPADQFTYVSQVPTVTAISSEVSGSFGARAVIPITVTFSEPVKVSGLPELLLNSGSGAKAVYSGGNGTGTLAFTYTVGVGQSTSDLDYTSTDALQLAGGTIQSIHGVAAILTLPAPGTDTLATQNIAVGPLSQGFESGNFGDLPWHLSNFRTAANWTVESTTVHDGSYAAQSGLIGPGSNSVLSLTATVQAGELSFWRSTTSATGTGSLIFEIDGVPQLQLSGTMPWQQSFFGVPAGQHTFSWIYGKNAGDATGADFANLDDIQFTPGRTLTIDGTPGNDVFNFDASGPAVVVELNGEIHRFAGGTFANYVFHGDGGRDFTYLAGIASGNRAILNADGSGRFTNSTAGYAVNLDGMTSIIAAGHTGDMVQFYDSPQNDIFYGYAADAGGQLLAGIYAAGGGYSHSASGFGINLGYASKGGSDTAVFFDSVVNDTFYSYADYISSGGQLAGMYGDYAGGYSNSASGFGTNIGISSKGGSDMAGFFDSAGSDLFYAYANYNSSGQHLAGMLGGSGGGYSNSARGFAANVGFSTNGGSDTATFFDTLGDDTFNAYANYQGSGNTFANMTGSFGGEYANSANGFVTSVGVSSGGSDTANLYDSTDNDTFYTDLAIASLYGNRGTFAEQALGFKTVNASGAQGGINSRSIGPDPLRYQLNLLGAWQS